MIFVPCNWLCIYLSSLTSALEVTFIGHKWTGMSDHSDWSVCHFSRMWAAEQTTPTFSTRCSFTVLSSFLQTFLFRFVPSPLTQGMRMCWCQAVTEPPCHVLWLLRRGDSRGRGGGGERDGRSSERLQSLDEEGGGGWDVKWNYWEDEGRGKNKRKCKVDSPKARDHAAEEEHAVALNEGREEGEEAVDGQGYQQALFTAQLVRQAAPKEGSKHHPQVHNATWRKRGRKGEREMITTIWSQTLQSRSFLHS